MEMAEQIRDHHQTEGNSDRHLAEISIVGVGTNYNLYTRNTLTSRWSRVPNSGDVTSITQLNDGVFLGVGTNKNLYTRDTLTSSWSRVANSCCVIDVIQLKFGPNAGTIVGVGTNNLLYTRAGLDS